MILLGLDPGVADTGYGVIDTAGGKERCLGYGSICTSARLSAPERLKMLGDELSALLRRHRPEAAAVEQIFFSKNVKTAIAVAEARGVIRLCLEEHGVRCKEFNPSQVKVAVCGDGGANKRQMQRMVRLLLGLKEDPKPDDAADALAIALTLAHTRFSLEQYAKNF